MKKIIVLFSILFIQLSFGQDTVSMPKEPMDENSAYKITNVDVRPEYPGGMTEFYNYIIRNFRQPMAKDFKGGRLVVQFVLEKDGSIVDIEVRGDLGFGTKEEAIRILKDCIKWIPAEKNGQKVRCFYTLPINLSSN